VRLKVGFNIDVDFSAFSIILHGLEVLPRFPPDPVPAMFVGIGFFYQRPSTSEQIEQGRQKSQAGNHTSSDTVAITQPRL